MTAWVFRDGHAWRSVFDDEALWRDGLGHADGWIHWNPEKRGGPDDPRHLASYWQRRSQILDETVDGPSERMFVTAEALLADLNTWRDLMRGAP